MSDLESIINGVEPDQVAPQIEAEPVQEETPEVVAEPEAKEPEPKQEPAMVPVSVVAELRQELRALREASQPRQQEPPAPDVFEDPEGYQKHVTTAAQRAILSSNLKMSRFMAERDFGAESVEAMMNFYNDNPQQTQAFLDSPSPFHAAMEQYNSARVAKEIGTDPVAYRAKLEAEIRGKLEAEMVAKQARDAAGKFAPSMANVTGTGGGPKSTWNGPTPLGSLFGE